MSNNYSLRKSGLSVRPVLRNAKLMFDANGGAGEMPNIESPCYASVKIPTSTFTRSGYVFAGWNTKADGSGKAYTADQYMRPTDDVTLYAQWVKIGRLYFVNKNGWSSVRVYLWEDDSDVFYAEWPGVLATKESITVNGYSIYSYNMVGKDQYDMIIFNNGTSQTSDLRIDYTKPYFYNGKWYSSLDDIN